MCHFFCVFFSNHLERVMFWTQKYILGSLGDGKHIIKKIPVQFSDNLFH